MDASARVISPTWQVRVSVLVPARNEARNLELVLPQLPDVHEVILVDGHSTDGTIEAAMSVMPDIKVVRQTRRGKGNALAAGFEAVTGDVVVMFDADGSADPREIERFVAALTDGADFAKGSRFIGEGGSSDITRLRGWGNRLLNKAANLMYGTRYSDLCYGYNAFWADVIPVLNLAAAHTGTSDEMIYGDGFEIETLINVRIARAGLKVVEVPSMELDRIHGVSNLNALTDGLRVARTLLSELRQPVVKHQPDSRDWNNRLPGEVANNYEDERAA